MPSEPRVIQLWDRIVELIEGIDGSASDYWYDLSRTDAVSKARVGEPPSGLIDGTDTLIDGETRSEAAFVSCALDSVVTGRDAELGIWRRDASWAIIGWAAAVDDPGDPEGTRQTAACRLGDDIITAIEAERDILLGGEYGLIDLQMSMITVSGDELGIQLGAGIVAIRLTGYWYSETGV